MLDRLRNGQSWIGIEKLTDFPPVLDLPMGWIVKLPVAAPDELKPSRFGEFLADMADEFPFHIGQVPPMDGVHDIDGTAVVVRALPCPRLACLLPKQFVLALWRTPQLRAEHRHTELMEAANERRLKLDDGRMSPVPMSAEPLFLPADAG